MTAEELWKEIQMLEFTAPSHALFVCRCEVCYGIWIKILAGRSKVKASPQFQVWLDSAMERWDGVITGESPPGR